MHREPLWPRTLFFALLCVLATTAGGAIAAMVRYDLVGFGHLPRAALAAAVVILLINIVLRLFRRRPFTTAQILYVYLAVLVVSGFPGQQLVTYLYISLVAPAQYATPENDYKAKFFEYLSPISVVSQEKDDPAIRWAYWGKPVGASIPWQPWVTPLAAWSLFFLLLFLNYLFLAGLLRRHWVEHQRIQFPLAQIPFELVRNQQTSHLLPPLLRSPLFWIAFAIPFTLHSLNALHFHYPSIPGINLRPILATFTHGPALSGSWNHLNYLGFNFYFDVIGVAYILPAEASFGLWFFWLFRYFLRVVRSHFGVQDWGPVYGAYGQGSYLLVAVVTVVSAWPDLRQQVLQAFGIIKAEERVHHPGEIVPTRLGVWGFLLTFAGLVMFAHYLGAAWLWSMVALVILLISMLVLSRLVSELGLNVVWSPIGGTDAFMAKAFGTQTIGARSMVALAQTSFHYSDTASATMASIFQGFKLADLGRLQSRHTLLLIVGALTLGIFASHPPSLYALYSRGIPSLGLWFGGAASLLPYRLDEIVEDRITRLGWGDYANMGVGALITWGLGRAYSQWTWWPLHPLAWTAAFSSGTLENYGFSFLLGWAISQVVLRIGDYKLFRAFQPFVLGLILGNGLTLLGWSVVHYFYPIREFLVLE